MIRFTPYATLLFGFYFVLLSLVSWPATSAESTRGFSFKPKTENSAQSPRLQYAIIISIDDYLYWPPLEYAGADGSLVANYLHGQGYKIIYLRDEDATKEGILNIFQRLPSQKIHRLLMFFAGHGQTVPTQKGEKGFIIPVDGRRKNYELYSVSLNALKEKIKTLSVQHTLMVFDSCYSGLALTRGGVKDETLTGYLAEVDRMYSIQVLTAGRKGDKAVEKDGQGLFTRFFVRALQGEADANYDGIVTASEINQWIRPIVFQESLKSQLPMYGRLAGEGDFLFDGNPREINDTAEAIENKWIIEARHIFRTLDEGKKQSRGSIKVSASLFEKLLTMLPTGENIDARSYILKTINYGVVPITYKVILAEGFPKRERSTSVKLETLGVELYRKYRKTKDERFLDKAILKYTTALRYDPTNARAFGELSLAYVRAKKYRYAVWAGLRAVDLSKSSATSAASLYNVALSFDRQGRSEQAMVFYLAALNLRKKNSKVYNIVKSRIMEIFQK